MQGYMWPQQQPPPRFPIKSPPAYQEIYQPQYQGVQNDQPSNVQEQFHHPISLLQPASAQHYATTQSSCSYRQGFTTQRTGQINQSQPQNHYMAIQNQPGHPNGNMYYKQSSMQSNVAEPKNYRNTNSNIFPMSWNYQLNSINMVDNNGGWTNNLPNKGSPSSVNYYHQSQSSRMGSVHYDKPQQPVTAQHSSNWVSMKPSGVQSTWNNGQNATDASGNNLTMNSGAHNNVALATNLNQVPINNSQSNFMSKPGPIISAKPLLRNLTTVLPSQGPTSAMSKIQTVQDNATQNQHYFEPRFANSIIYKLLVNKNISGEYSQKQSAFSTNKNKGGHLNECLPESISEPPRKRGKLKKDWKRTTSVTKNNDDNAAHSTILEKSQMDASENISHSAHTQQIQSTVKPTIFSEVNKAPQHGHKVVGVVLPISQQTLNKEQPVDVDLQKESCPPFAVDCVWSLSKEENPESPPQPPQCDKSVEEDKVNSKKSDTCLFSPANENDLADGDSREPLFDLTSMPTTKHTLKNLMDLVELLENKEKASGYPEQSEGIADMIFQQYGNGNKKDWISLRKEFMASEEMIVRDLESVVIESVETKTLKQLTHCEILKEMYSWSSEFKSSWLNVDPRAFDENVLKEALLGDKGVFCVTSHLENANVTSSNVGENSVKDLSDIPTSVNPDISITKDFFTPKRGNDDLSFASENKNHSNAVMSLSSGSSETETIKKQFDINQSPTTESVTDKPTDTESEHLRKDHPGKVCPIELLPLSPENSLSGGANIRIVEISGETLWNLMNASQIKDVSDKGLPVNTETSNTSEVFQSEVHTRNEDSEKNRNPLFEEICDDDYPGIDQGRISPSKTQMAADHSNKEDSEKIEFLPNCLQTGVVENNSDYETFGEIVVLPQESITWLVKDITDSKHSRDKESAPLASEIRCVVDISDDENTSNVDILSESTDICVIEDVSSDENSSDDSSLMCTTLLSSEDAKLFFHQFDKKLESSPKPKCLSNSDCPELNPWFETPRDPNLNGRGTCSRCFKETGISNPCTSPEMDTKDPGDKYYCCQCWEQAPVLELEQGINVLPFPAQFKEQGVNCGTPFLTLEVEDSDELLAVNLVGEDKAALVEKCIEWEKALDPATCDPEVKTAAVESTEEIIPDETLMGQIRDSVALPNQQQNCNLDEELSMPKIDFLTQLKLKQHTQQATNQKRDKIVKSVMKTMAEIHNLNCKKVNNINLGMALKKKQVKQNFAKPQPLVENSFSKKRQKPANLYTVSGNSELFTPDVVIKRNYSENTNLDNTSPNKTKQPTLDQTLEKSLQNQRKMTTVNMSSNEIQQSSCTPVNKTKTNQPMKLTFNLFGSGKGEQYYAKDRHFTAPTSLTVFASFNDYGGELSAKQKVHNLWCSTFIPKTKTFDSRKQRNKRTLKPRDLLSNIRALKSHLVQRAINVSSREIKPSYVKKPNILAKANKTMSS